MVFLLDKTQRTMSKIKRFITSQFEKQNDKELGSFSALVHDWKNVLVLSSKCISWADVFFKRMAVFRTRQRSRAFPSPPICCQSPCHTGTHRKAFILNFKYIKAFTLTFYTYTFHLCCACVCMFFHACLPGHQRPAPSKCGWRWPLACGCSRSLCCGKHSTLWGLGWTCQSSLCSPAEESAVIKLNLAVMSRMPFSSSVHKALCDIYNCGWASVWVWPHFDMPMTNPSVVGQRSMPCAAHHHIRKHLTRGTAGTKLMWQTNCCTERTVNNTQHCFCWCCCQFIFWSTWKKCDAVMWKHLQQSLW